MKTKVEKYLKFKKQKRPLLNSVLVNNHYMYSTDLETCVSIKTPSPMANGLYCIDGIDTVLRKHENDVSEYPKFEDRFSTAQSSYIFSTTKEELEYLLGHASTDETRIHLNSIHLNIENGTMVSTDGFSLTTLKKNFKSRYSPNKEEKKSWIISRDSIKKILQCSTKKSDITCYTAICNSFPIVIFSIDDTGVNVSCCCIDRDYVNPTSILNLKGPSETFFIPHTVFNLIVSHGKLDSSKIKLLKVVLKGNLVSLYVGEFKLYELNGIQSHLDIELFYDIDILKRVFYFDKDITVRVFPAKLFSDITIDGVSEFYNVIAGHLGPKREVSNE
jgi:hypothetical protein